MKPALARLLAAGAFGVLASFAGGMALGQPQAQAEKFSFGIVAHAAGASTEERLREAIQQTDADNLAFVVVNGIKDAGEACSDKLYDDRLRLFESAKNGLVLSLSGSDWIDCRTSDGRPAAIERLARVRDLFFDDDFSLGASRIPLTRQSITPKFNTYVENTRWEFGDVLFATLNVPGNNNHYSAEGGRNGEFEDRLIANRDWLKRLFVIAHSRKFAAVVIFSDGNLDPAAAASKTVRRDGFVEMRSRVGALAADFPGRVLLVEGQNRKEETNAGRIVWRGNLGRLSLPAGWSRITLDPAKPGLFVIGAGSAARPAR